MSLGGGYSKTINKLVDSMLEQDENMYMAVAAGNEDQNACNVSPASAKNVLTVMASDKYDQRAWFSNWGECADIYAPGVDVMSTIPKNKVASYSGTSMSSPVMVGVLNHYVDMYPNLNMKQIKEQLVKDSTQKVVKGKKFKTSSNLVFLNRSV